MRKSKSSIPNLLSAVYNRLRREAAQALVEYAIIFPLQLLITLTIIQLAQIFVAKQVLEYAAFCGARARLVALSEDEVRKAIIIPISRLCPRDDASDTAYALTIPGRDPNGLPVAWGSRAMSAATANVIRAQYVGNNGLLNNNVVQQGGTNWNRWNQELTQFNTTYSNQATLGFLSGCGIANANTTVTPPTSPPLSNSGTQVVSCDISHYYEMNVPIGNVVAYNLGDILLGSNDLTVDAWGVPCLLLHASCLLAQPWAQPLSQ